MIDLNGVVPPEAVAVFVGAIVLGIVHGAEPGHGWPIAATYALDRERKWLHGLLASFLLGFGHLVSSLAVVVAFFLAKGYFELERIDDPMRALGFEIGGPVSVVAGVLLVALGIREYRHGYSRGHDLGHGHVEGHAHGAQDHDETPHHAHSHDSSDQSGGADDEERGWLGRIVGAMPFVGGHSHDHTAVENVDRRGLSGIVWTAFLLGFVHEEEFEIIGLCLGTDYCLELMAVYAIAVMCALVGFTLLLIAGYYRYEERVDRYTDYLPAISAVVLVTMGAGFVFGVF